jgi:hypothetical protein
MRTTITKHPKNELFCPRNVVIFVAFVTNRPLVMVDGMQSITRGIIGLK